MTRERHLERMAAIENMSARIKHAHLTEMQRECVMNALFKSLNGGAMPDSAIADAVMLAKRFTESNRQKRAKNGR